MRFQDIPQFTGWGNYAVDHEWRRLDKTIQQYVTEFGLDMNPDFQRGYVWTLEQKTSFVEYGLKGGISGRDILMNCPGWNKGKVGDIVLVDGKQRIEAVLGFLDNRVQVFGGHYFSDFTDEMRLVKQRFRFHVNDLETRQEVLQWYLDLNSGGTVHTEADLEKVRKMLEKEKER